MSHIHLMKKCKYDMIQTQANLLCIMSNTFVISSGHGCQDEDVHLTTKACS